MSQILPLNRCRMCGASSYRSVLDRDGAGVIRATGLYRCSGCNVVFANPRAWREGGAAVSPSRQQAPVGLPRTSDWRTHGSGPSVTGSG